MMRVRTVSRKPVKMCRRSNARREGQDLRLEEGKAFKTGPRRKVRNRRAFHPLSPEAPLLGLRPEHRFGVLPWVESFPEGAKAYQRLRQSYESMGTAQTMRLLMAMTDRASSLKGEGIRFIFTVRSTLGGYWSDMISSGVERCVSFAYTPFFCFAIGTSFLFDRSGTERHVCFQSNVTGKILYTVNYWSLEEK
jgi:hypothetical protein